MWPMVIVMRQSVW